jgi:TetR/AcrR family transcriptional regulator, transcriptional repressor for nem operon
MLLDAAIELGAERPLAAIPVDDIVREAGVAKGTFYVHFADRSAFMVELHTRFELEMRRAVAAAVEGLSPGRDRLLTGARASLDACAAQSATKSLLLEARADPSIANAIARRNEAFAQDSTDDFAVLGVADPDVAARLFVAMVAEAALVEIELGRTDERVRSALGSFVTNTE